MVSGQLQRQKTAAFVVFPTGNRQLTTDNYLPATAGLDAAGGASVSNSGSYGKASTKFTKSQICFSLIAG